MNDSTKAAALLASGVDTIALAFVAPAICTVDGGSMFAVAYSIIHGTLAVPHSSECLADTASTTRNGTPYYRLSLCLSWRSEPCWALTSECHLAPPHKRQVCWCQ